MYIFIILKQSNKRSGGDIHVQTTYEQQRESKGKSLNQWQDSGSDYHREHASNVPDYGANTVDSIAKKANTSE